MKRILFKTIVLTPFLFYFTPSLAAGLFFNITNAGTTLSITTTIPHHTYPNAGIKINTAGYSIASGCTPAANGYCLFSVSDTHSTTLSINGSTGTMNASLCLSGLGPLSCQNYSLSLVATTAYVANFNNDTVSICPVKSDGSFGACTTSSGNDTFNGPRSMALNPAKTMVYIGNYNNNTVSICPISGSGSLGTCTSATDSTFNGLTGVALNSSGTYFYASSNSGGTISICPVNANGSLGTCSSSTGSGRVSFASNQFVSLQVTNGTTYLYATGTPTQNAMAVCSIDNTTGSITSYDLSSGSSPSPNPTVLTPQGLSFNNAGTFAYIGNAGSTDSFINYVSICPTQSNGTFGTSLCSISFGPDSNGNGTFNFTAASGIGLFMSSASNYGYIPNNGNNTVSICTLNTSDGSLSACTTTNGNGTFNKPSAIVLKTAS